jgi:predicted RNase H-like nuclease
MTSTSIIGFDSAWTDQVRAPGAICIIRCELGSAPLFVAPKLSGFAQALDLVRAEALRAKRILVAIDQPTIVPNGSGSRPVDKVAASLISWLGGGVQPANRSKLGMFDDAAPIWAFKDALGAVEDPETARGSVEGTYIAEVFPALAIPSLATQFCGRLLGARYNPGRRRTFKLEHWSAVLDCAAAAGSVLGIEGVDEWCKSHARRSGPSKSD